MSIPSFDDVQSNRKAKASQSPAKPRATILPAIHNVDFWKMLHGRGLIPPNVRRFIIDSGEPGGVVKIYFDCFAEPNMLEAFVEELMKQNPDTTCSL